MRHAFLVKDISLEQVYVLLLFCVLRFLMVLWEWMMWDKWVTFSWMHVTVHLLISDILHQCRLQILCVIVCKHLCPWIFFFFFCWGFFSDFIGWGGIWLEWILTAQSGLMSCQSPLKDKLPNAVILEHKSSSMTDAWCVPQTISTPHPSLLALLASFSFHTVFIFLPPVAHNLQQCPVLF